MPVTFVKRAAEIFRDYITDMVPESGIHKPPKAHLRTWGTELEDQLTAVEETQAAGASKVQTGEPFYGVILGGLSDRDYRIVLKATHGGTITETTTRCVSGTATATFKINTTALGGTANSVSSDEESQAHASDNTFVAGDDIVITISSNATCIDMSFSIKYTRTLS